MSENKHRICVYPYSDEFEPVLRHMNLLEPDYAICALISPRGWGLEGKEADCGVSAEKLIVRSAFGDILPDINTLLIPEFESDEQFAEMAVNSIIGAPPKFESVLCFAKFSEAQINKLADNFSSQSHPPAIDDQCSFEAENVFEYESNDTDMHLEPLDVPIVAVAGTWWNIDKFETSLALREMFLSNGYKVSQIGSRNYCELMGFHSFPSFMFDPRVDAAKKIVCFNRYVKRIIEKEQPDVVIVGVPGSIQSLNDEYTNGFGLLAYLTFQAITVDFLVLCSFYDHKTDAYLKLMSESCKYKFGCAADCFHMSNLFIDFTMTSERKSIVTNKIARSYVSKCLDEIDPAPSIPVLNIYDKQDCRKLFDMIIDKLTFEP
ncbi:MAG: TIGR04066 family peptide maturation system protein [Clostridiales bacterium]|jgi:peptide maturation system protein (TIGR04066 family)|nr:TIGR04066 family peptide maturation system protein [Clostridiales bacterium]